MLKEVKLINIVGVNPIILVQERIHFLHGSEWSSIREARKRTKNSKYNTIGFVGITGF
jgi:hypothetical protein